MSGETEEKESAWTTDTLKEYFEAKIEANDKRYEERWQAQEAAAKNLKEYQNEFRGSLDDLSTKQATKVELNTGLNNLSEKIDSNSVEIGTLRSRLDVGPVGLQQLQTQQSLSTGRGIGLQAALGYILAAIAIVGFFLQFRR